MIRWKQKDIHAKRQQRRDQFDMLKLEFETTGKFLNMELKPTGSRAAIAAYLEKLAGEVDIEYTEPMRQCSQKKIEAWPANFEPPTWGPILGAHVPWHEEILKLCAFSKDDLVTDPLATVLSEWEKSKKKFADRQVVIKKQLDLLDAEMNDHITMDNLTTGFNKTSMPPKQAIAPAADHSKTGGEMETIHTPSGAFDAGYPELKNDILDQLQCTDENLAAVHPKLLALSHVTSMDERKRHLQQNPEFLDEKIEEVLLLRAIAFQVSKLPCLHILETSLILKFVRQLGASAIDMFFDKYLW